MLSFKNLLRRKVRTALSLLGIAIGIAAIVAFSSIAASFKRNLNQYAEQTGAQIIVMEEGLPEPRDGRITREDMDAIRAMPEVSSISDMGFLPARPKGSGFSMGFPMLLLLGRNPEERAMRRYRNDELQGTLPKTDDEIILGYIAAEKMGKKVGETVTLWKGGTFKIVGIYRVGISWENAGAVTSVRNIQKKLGMGTDTMAGLIYLNNSKDTDRVKKEIQKRYPHLKAVRTEEFGANFDQLEYIDWFVWVISLVSVLVGGLGILNTMLMSVSERTREIGTLRAVGWSHSRVLRLILREGTLISFFGGLVGLLVGYVAAEVILMFAPDGFLGTYYTPLLFVQAMAVALGLGFFGTLYPAFRASRLTPLEALRYE